MAAGFPTKNNWIAGDVLTASAMDDLGTTVNYTQYHTPRNVVLNSAFDIWQAWSGSSPSLTPFTGLSTADRWFTTFDGTGSTRNVSRQNFTPGTAPVSGQEYPYYCRYAITVAGSGATVNQFYNKIEDVRTFAGQTVTLSFWAKADTANTLTPSMVQNFGSGGSPSANVTTTGSAINITTSWVRYTQTFAIPSITGKTLGTTANTSFLQLTFAMPLNATGTFDYFGIQLEKGSYANEYFRNGTNIAAELASCQRFAYSLDCSTALTNVAMGYNTSTTSATGYLSFPVTMIAKPTLGTYTTYGGTSYAVIPASGSVTCSATPTIGLSTPNGTTLVFPVVSGLVAGQGVLLQQKNATTGYPLFYFDSGL